MHHARHPPPSSLGVGCFSGTLSVLGGHKIAVCRYTCAQLRDAPRDALGFYFACKRRKELFINLELCRAGRVTVVYCLYLGTPAYPSSWQAPSPQTPEGIKYLAPIFAELPPNE